MSKIYLASQTALQSVAGDVSTIQQQISTPTTGILARLASTETQANGIVTTNQNLAAVSDQINNATTGLVKKVSDITTELNASVTGVKPRLSKLEQIAQVDSLINQSTLDLNFAENKFRVYEQYGNTDKTLTQALTINRASTATHSSPTALVTAAVDTFRIEANPYSGSAPALLCEEQRTNICLQSKDLTTTWIQSPNADVDVTANAAIAPDGTMTADKFVEATTANTFHDLYQNQSFTAGVTYTFSAFVKAAERTRGTLTFGIQTAFTGERRVVYDLIAKTAVAGGAGAAAGILEYPNGWFLVWVTATADATGVSPYYARLLNSTGTSIYAGTVGSGLFITDCQLEVGSFPSSRIPTTTAQVTRAADVISRTLSTAANEGTIFAIARGEASVFGINQSIFTLSDGTTNNRILIRRNNTTAGTSYLVLAGGVNVAQVNTTQKVAGQRNKYAISWKTNQFLAAEDGALVMNDTSGAAPANLSQLGIGSAGAAFGGGDQLNGTIERVVFIPRALTAAELQAITT